MDSEKASASQRPEPLHTLKDAAKIYGVPLFKMRRAYRAGLFPGYRLFNGRVLVRLSEVEAALERVGGGR